MNLAPRSFHPISDDPVAFTVKVDPKGCEAANHSPSEPIKSRLDGLEQNGITVSPLQIYTAAAHVYQYEDQPTSEANVQQAAMTLQQWTLTPQQGRLIAIPPLNDKLQTDGTALLGVGVGLQVASHLYDVPLQEWRTTRRNNPFDHTAVDPQTGGTIEVEARGRYNFGDWAGAIDGAKRKLSKRAKHNPRSFAYASAILFAPRPDNEPSDKKDILIIDPAGMNRMKNPHQRLQNIVAHYARVLENLAPGQGPRPFATRLAKLAQSDVATFERYLQKGKSAEENAALRYSSRVGVLDKPWRSVVRYDGYRFCGTDFAGVGLPFAFAGYTPQPGQGAFFFGLWEAIIEALRDGRVQEIADMSVTPVTSQYDGKLFVLSEDGTAMAFAPTAEQISTGMFDGLFANAHAAANGHDAQPEVQIPTKERSGV